MTKWLDRAVPLFIVAALLPIVLFRYLPMTDLPQHEAVVSILRHLHDPAYGFEAYYHLALGRTLYVLPYALALALSYVVPVHLAMQIVVLISVAAYPLGLWLLLRAQGKPAWLALLSVPLIYNRAFYWGFVFFLLAIGLALATIAVAIGERRSRRSDVVLALLGLATLITHVYGVLIIAGYLAVWAIFGDRAALWRRLPALVPAILGAAMWTLLASEAKPYGGYDWLAIWPRVRWFADAILGGFRGVSENVELVAMIAAAALAMSWRRAGAHEKTAAAFIGLNMILYFALPQHTPTAKFLHFRHALLAVQLLPLVVAGARPRAAAAAAAIVALFAIVNVWTHLARFDREARSFDGIIAASPPRPSVAPMVYDSNGAVMLSLPYLHFSAYLQAEKGGLQAISFPRMFWNIPLSFDESTGVPEPTPYLEWEPQNFSDEALGRWFGFIALRTSGTMTLPKDFPFHMIAAAGAWQLWKRN